MQDRATGVPYALLFSFVGPEPSFGAGPMRRGTGKRQPQEQRDRKFRARQANLCNELSDAALGRALDKSTTQICLVEIGVPVSLPRDFPGGITGPDNNPVPDALVKAIGRPSRVQRMTLAAMYLIDTAEPCVLQYICIGEPFRRFGLGAVVLQHFETFVAGRYGGDRCRDLYLAAVRDPPNVVRFYQANGWELVNVATDMTPPVLDAAGPVTGEVAFGVPGRPDLPPVRVHVYPDTVVLRKQIHTIDAPQDKRDDVGVEQAEALPLFATALE